MSSIMRIQVAVAAVSPGHFVIAKRWAAGSEAIEDNAEDVPSTELMQVEPRISVKSPRIVISCDDDFSADDLMEYFEAYGGIDGVDLPATVSDQCQWIFQFKDADAVAAVLDISVHRFRRGYDGKLLTAYCACAE